MRVTLQPAYVLHRRPYLDTGLLLETLTAEHGRCGLVARGARSRGSRRAARLQAFRPLLISWSGRGELPTVGQVEEAGAPLSMPMDRVWSALYLNELLLRLLPRRDPMPELFEAYGVALRALASAPGEERCLRVFEKRLLGAMGYGLRLETDAGGAAVHPGLRYRYAPDAGPEADPCGQIPGRSLLDLAAERLEHAEALRDAKRITRAALAVHLGGRPLRTRELAAAVRRGPVPAGTGPQPGIDG